MIGGGGGGTSIALHLAEAGWDDIVLLEKGDIADGTTWHSAGLVGQLRSTRGLTQVNRYSVELYRRLTDDGYDPGWHEVGSLRLMSSPDRVAAAWAWRSAPAPPSSASTSRPGG